MATPNGNLVEGVIANLPLFKHSSKPHLAELARHARTQHVSRGTLIAHRGDKLRLSACFLSPLRQIYVRTKACASRRISAARDDGAGDDEHARAQHRAVLRGLAQRYIRIARALGAEISDGGEAGE